jgi:ABC-type sugar transport system substrate-binding protein
LFGFAAAASAADKIVIGLTASNMANESNAIYGEAAQVYVKTLPNVELIFVDGEGSSEKQVAQCENFVSQKVDVVILSPEDLDGAVPGAKACVEAGIPVIASKAPIADMSLVKTYVGSNDRNAGLMEMTFIAGKLGGKGNIVIIQGPTASTGAILRQEGIEEILKKYPDIKVLYVQPADWYRDRAMALMENWLQLGTQIDAVVAHNDEMALGAYDALKAAGKAESTFIIGIDGIAAAFKSVNEGGLTASILQDSKSIAEKSIDVAVMIAKGESIDKEYDIPFTLVTKENVADFLK